MKAIRASVLLAACALAAYGGQAPRRGFRAESRLVIVNASVFDGQNRFVADLRPENFRVFDEAEEMRLVSVGVEDVPLSSVILMDVSRSMEADIGNARDAVSRFLDQARPGDEFCLMAFSDRVAARCGFTSDVGRIREEAAAIIPGGNTALDDALLAAIAAAKLAHNTRQMILLLTDGEDTSSAHRWREVRRAALESLAVLYGVNLPGWRDRDVWQWEQLHTLVEETGGRMLTARTTKQLPGLLSQLEARMQYVLTYVPPAAADSKPVRHVRVKLSGGKAQHLRVYWRHNYSVAMR